VVPFTEVGNQMKNEAIKSGTTTNKQGKFNKCNAHNYCYSSRWKNPAHGQPSHRCDIPVGAPLNSPPATTTP
jgi:hypothetical protein